MSRDLVWLQKFSFAAWGCAACSWIMPIRNQSLSGQSSAPIRAAFDKHDCKRFPRYISPKERRPSRTAGL